MLGKILKVKNQIILAKCKENKATVVMVEKRNHRWNKIMCAEGFIGENGIGKTIEGDKKTPKGLFKLGISFGIKENPRNGITIYQSR